MLNSFSRSWSIISVAVAATAIATLDDRRLLGVAIVCALLSMWVAGVADGHEHLRRKKPEAFGGDARKN